MSKSPFSPAESPALNHNQAQKAAASTLVLSIHIPKTGGVSFRRILAQLYQEDFLLKYWLMTDARGRTVASIPPNTRCIHGHFAADVLLPSFPNARLITWVRDPVERVASSYYHRLREPDWQHPITRELHQRKLSLVEFAGLELMRNETARYFGSRKVKDFAFIGRMERYEESAARFLREFGFGHVHIPRENCNPERTTEHYPIDRETRLKIESLNELDREIYQAVCQAET